jgi:hypothetical protein
MRLQDKVLAEIEVDEDERRVQTRSEDFGD